jgi:hypothetical protein
MPTGKPSGPSCAAPTACRRRCSQSLGWRSRRPPIRAKLRRAVLHQCTTSIRAIQSRPRAITARCTTAPTGHRMAPPRPNCSSPAAPTTACSPAGTTRGHRHRPAGLDRRHPTTRHQPRPPPRRTPPRQHGRTRRRREGVILALSGFQAHQCRGQPQGCHQRLIGHPPRNPCP